ncbi:MULTISPECIES: flagellar basal-body MS-ring/collar protein FliF [unclassified Devosia]|uniref:flagellar basal-body MS-ring/collar protein FliF n=1 Tax=unclassified Devosia TaxID=196773 RepID=UPI001AC0F9AD|nr:MULTISPECIES: flagellar basal-body MS-ring/collar protein FliF [unclassified Devosia]MBN9306784.1 flagellar M-ring protein FliF [Devosia sp.]
MGSAKRSGPGGIRRVGLVDVLQLFNRLGLQRIAAMAVVAVLMLGFFAFLIMRASTPQMAPLYTGLSFEDSSAIVGELQKQNIPNEIRGDGDTILVPRDQITSIRMQLAENGLPKKGQVGYEIFDQQNTLGATSFVQNINNVRALEGELARTISSLARIKSTRVHLVLPERALFSRDKKDPTASIVVSVRGQLSNEEIRAIQHLVASAVEGLTPNRVTIADDTGNLLAAGVGDGDDSTVLAGEADERKTGLENRLRTSIEGLLANIVGDGRARVEVSADLDMTRVTKTAQTFDPNGQVVRSTQTESVANNSTDASNNSGQVSASTQLPGANSNASSAAAGTSEQGSTDKETTNYEISNVSQTEMTDPGAIKRLSVAVLVDGTYTTDPQGNSKYTPRDQAVLDQIKSLVQSAIGFDDKRGDQITVANLQFAQGPTPTVQGTSGPGLFDFTRDDLINGAEMLVTLIIALALVFFVMRPLLKRVLSPETQPLALPISAEVGAPAPAVPGAPATMVPASELVRDDAASPPMIPGWMKDAKTQGAAQAQTLKTVGSLVQDNPKQAALIVRDWLSSAV